MESRKDCQGIDQSNSSDKSLISNPTQAGHPQHYHPQHYSFIPHQAGYPHQASYPPHLFRFPPQLAGYPPAAYAHTFGNPSYGYSAPSTIPDEGPNTSHSGINPSNIRIAENDCESSLKNSDDKKGQLRWNTTLDNVLLDMLGEAAREGKKTGKKWDTTVWNNLLATLSEKANEVVRSSHIDNRIRQMRNEFNNFVELKKKSGLSYDPAKQTIVASDEYWKELLSNPKDNKRFKAFKGRGLKWDYEKLSLVIGNSYATGSYSINGLDEEKDSEKNGEESVDLEVGEETVSTASMKKAKRQHGKRMRGVDEVKSMLEGVNEHLAQLRETIDPLNFGKQLREAVMEVQGFSHKYLNCAFKILMKNHVDAEIFLLTDKEGRLDVLNDLVGQIGDI